MNDTRKLSLLQQAAAQANRGAKLLRELGFVRQEVSQDDYGIEWSRWTLIHPAPGKTWVHVVMWATPHGFDIFEAVTYENSIEAVRKGLERSIATT